MQRENIHPNFSGWQSASGRRHFITAVMKNQGIGLAKYRGIEKIFRYRGLPNRNSRYHQKIEYII